MKKLFFLIVAVIMALPLCACDNVQSVKQINIAVMGSKEVYDLDSSFLNGVKLAVEDCNKDYIGKNFVVGYEIFDDKYDFEKGLIIADEIAHNPKYTAVLGSHSFSIMEAATPLFEENNKILLAVNSMMDKSIIGKGYKNIFRNTAGEADTAKSLAAYAKAAGLKRFAVCHSETEFEMNVVKKFGKEIQAQDIKILSYVTSIGSERSFKQNVDKWNLLGIDGVFICRDSISDAFTLAKYIRTFSDSIKITGDFSFDASDKIKEYQEYVQGIVIPTLMPITKSDKLSAFERRYYEVYNEKPTWWAAHGYDSVRIVVDSAVKTGSADTKIIAEKIHDPQGYDGLTGTLVFDKDGAMTGDNRLYCEISGDQLQFKSINDLAEGNVLNNE